MAHESPCGPEEERRLAERAAEWWSLIEESGAEGRVEFAAWLRESPRHLQAYLHTDATAQLIRDIAPERIAQLMQGLTPSAANVLRLPQGASAPRASMSPARAPMDSQVSQPESPRRRAWAAGLAGLVAILAALPGSDRNRWQTYATRIAEQRSLELPDRSLIYMNGRTRLQVRYAGGAREVRLIDGEALFEVAHDATRPFRVHSGASVIQAVGTEFNVLRRASGTTVSVAEGLVQVSQARLAAGEVARIEPSGRIEKGAPVDVVTVSAWRRHRLIFHADTLADIAAEFNRYNRTPQIVVEGEAGAARRYSGAFDANDPRSFMEFLRWDPQLTLVAGADRLVIRIR